MPYNPYGAFMRLETIGRSGVAFSDQYIDNLPRLAKTMNLLQWQSRQIVFNDID